MKTGFNNNHKITVRDHILVPKFGRMWQLWKNTKKHISDIKPFS